MKLKIKGNEAIIEDVGDDPASTIMAGVKGNIKLRTPFGKRNLKIVDSFKSEKKEDKKLDGYET